MFTFSSFSLCVQPKLAFGVFVAFVGCVQVSVATSGCLKLEAWLLCVFVAFVGCVQVTVATFGSLKLEAWLVCVCSYC